MGFFLGERVSTVALPQASTTHRVWLAALLLIAVLLWITCIVLLITITTQLLDVLHFVVELAQMG